MSAEPQFPGPSPETKSRHLTLVRSHPDENGSVLKREDGKVVRALVPEATPRNSRKLIIGVFSLLPLVLLFILMVNIVTASRQYDLVDLRNQEQTLTQENEALAQEIEYYQAPQDLAIRASQLGLVSTSAQATIDLQTGEISGTPLVATEGEEKNKNLIDPPSLHDTDASATASERAAEQAKKEKEEEKKEAEASASASASATASQQSQQAGDDQSPPAETGEEENQ